jgi:hypothetical protein
MSTRRRRQPHPKTRGGFWRTSTPLFTNAMIARFTQNIPTDIQLVCNQDIFDHMDKKTVLEQSKLCCASQITEDYKINSFVDALSRTRTNYEILSAIDSTNSLVGFIICELGECKALKNVWSVRLICVNRQKRTHKLSSTLLLGAMMYSLKEKGEKFAVLELSNAYNNIEGFISYSKLGFIKNVSLYGKDCFKNPMNLPMYTSLHHLTQQDIVDLVLRRKEIELTVEQENTGLFEKYKYSIRHSKKVLDAWNDAYRSGPMGGEAVLLPQKYAFVEV